MGRFGTYIHEMPSQGNGFCSLPDTQRRTIPMHTTNEPIQPTDTPAVHTTDIPVQPANTPAVSDRQAGLRISSRLVAMTGLMLILLFFSPFVSCGDETFSGVEAFQQSVEMQTESDMLSEGSYVSGLSLILFPVAGLVGLLVGLAALPRIQQRASVRGYATIALLVALATGWPIFEAVRVVTRSEGVWEMEWGFYGSVLAAVGMLFGALGMYKKPDKQT
jgi:hypothetical protein